MWVFLCKINEPEIIPSWDGVEMVYHTDLAITQNSFSHIPKFQHSSFHSYYFTVRHSKYDLPSQIFIMPW